MGATGKVRKTVRVIKISTLGAMNVQNVMEIHPDFVESLVTDGTLPSIKPHPQDGQCITEAVEVEIS